MSVFLLDVNLLVALAWPEHGAHDRAGKWFARNCRNGWATCLLTQAGLVRILSNPAFSTSALSPRNALAVLEANTKLTGHRFWPDDITLMHAFDLLGERPAGHRQITDFYLVALALHHGGRLATMDEALGVLSKGVELV